MHGKTGMNDSFDPYHKWLGIPPEDQPPHHYRLLGVEPFESDADVIMIAADGRMAQLKHFQAGQYSDLSQKMLNEIATAKVCLLNPEKREKYDDTLRQRLEEAKKPAVKATPAEQKSAAQTRAGEPAGGVTVTSGGAAPQIDPAGVSSYLSRHNRKRRNRWLLPAAASVVAVGLIVVLVIAFAGQTDTPDVPVADRPTNRSPGEKNPESPIPIPPDPIQDPLPEDPGNGEPIDPDTVASAADQGRSLADLIDPMEPGESPEPPVQGDTGDPPVAKRLPVPDAEAKKEATAEIRTAFKSDLAAAKTSESKLKLVESFLADSRDPGSKPAVRFVLMQMACQMAAEAGGLAESLAAADELVRQFDVDGGQIRSYVFKTVRASLATVGRDLEVVQSIIDTAMQQADAALTGDDIDTASDAVQLALAAAKVTKDNYILRQVNTRAGELRALKNVFKKVKPAMETLAEKPDDAEANWEVGRWRCFCIGAWEAGLPLLAKGSDDQIAELAELDVAEPKDAQEQVRLGDGWYATAGRESKYAKINLYRRARHWYERALPNLAPIKKRSVDNRLKEIVKTLQSTRRQDGGIVQEGNVALASRGTTASGVTTGAKFLLDGDNTDYTAHAWSLYPCEWTITFPVTYRLQAMHFLLHDTDKTRFYRYRIRVSSDGKTFTDLVDRSRGEWRSWQQMVFPPRPVRAVKLLGLYNSANAGFHVVEFEAYYKPPPKALK